MVPLLSPVMPCVEWTSAVVIFVGHLIRLQPRVKRHAHTMAKSVCRLASPGATDDDAGRERQGDIGPGRPALLLGLPVACHERTLPVRPAARGCRRSGRWGRHRHVVAEPGAGPPRDSAPGISHRAGGWAARSDSALSRRRQQELQTGARPVVVGGPKTSAMRLNDGPADRQAHAHAVRLGGVERLEHPARLRRIDAGT